MRHEPFDVSQQTLEEVLTELETIFSEGPKAAAPAAPPPAPEPPPPPPPGGGRTSIDPPALAQSPMLEVVWVGTHPEIEEPIRRKVVRKLMVLFTKGARPSVDAFLALADEVSRKRWKSPFKIDPIAVREFAGQQDPAPLAAEAQTAGAHAVLAFFETEDEAKAFAESLPGTEVMVRALPAAKAADRVVVIDFLVELMAI